MKIGRLCNDDDGRYFVIPVDKISEFWNDHEDAFKEYPIEKFLESGKYYQEYLDKWSEYAVDNYNDLDIMMSDPDNIIRLLYAASSALKSYQYGNQSSELAITVSSDIDEFLDGKFPGYMSQNK